MKYNTISSSSLSSEGKRATLTIYTDPDFAKEKVASTEAEITSIRSELEIVQRALKLQTRRCRQLVAEYTRRLQEKEQHYQSERMLRDDQLAKVLRALLIFEARLRQEQKYISHQLREKDYMIKKQRNDINKLMSNQYCKHCNQYYSPTSNMESMDSSSEYVATDYQDYQSSNFESLDSSSETYATISEKDYDSKKTTGTSELSFSGEETGSNDRREIGKSVFQKNKFSKDSIARRGRKFGHRKSVGTYFEVLKLRNDSPTSNEDNTSNDYENLDSLPPESIADKISVVSERIESSFVNKENTDTHSNTSSTNGTDSDCNDTVIQNCKPSGYVEVKEASDELSKEDAGKNQDEFKTQTKITDSIPIFDGDSETNDKWYASGSEQEDEEHRDIYRNNPVLECMNQILLHNINDATKSPPKTPSPERKFSKNNKRVKFSDEEENVQKENAESPPQNNYYETPIQKVPNFYETPQSIYSNDYEQILSKCSESTSPVKQDSFQEKEVNILSTKKLSIAKNIDFESRNGHYYDMDTTVCEKADEPKIVRKSKILRTPPALPPKPTNLVSKYKLHHNLQNKLNLVNEPAIESEPDYCSISELNLPTKTLATQKINVVAELNAQNLESNRQAEKQVVLHKPKENDIDMHYDPVVVNNDIANLVSKNVETFKVQLAKQTSIKTEGNNELPAKPKPKQEPEIPKLPQVSEIIIPDENEAKSDEERISQDNYVKNNSQILKLKTVPRPETLRRPIVIGSSVSSLITGFNNQQLLSEIQQKPERHKPTPRKVFTSFEAKQNSEKHAATAPKKQETTLTFDFDLSQNFEEFKLEDCEIGEEFSADVEDHVKNVEPQIEEHKMPDVIKSPSKLKPNSTRVELVRATNNVTVPQLSVTSIQLLRRKLELQKASENSELSSQKNGVVAKKQNEPTYEHFLECTGLSSKSILTPSRLLSNHKSMLKPKDVKLRSKVKSNSIFERNGNTIKYWSEPYI